MGRNGSAQQNRRQSIPPQSTPNKQQPPERKNEPVREIRRQQEQSLLGFEKGDITLAAMLFLLYLESRDEDFLIILAIIAFSIFKSDKKDE